MDRILCLLIYLITAFSRFSKFFARLGIGSYEEWELGKKLKILLVGYNGARNTGSDVRVVAIARQIRDLLGKDHVRITVMTLNVKSLEGYFDEDVVLLPFSSLFPWHVYRACSNQETIHRNMRAQSAKYQDKLADMGVFLKQYIQDALQHSKK